MNERKKFEAALWNAHAQGFVTPFEIERGMQIYDLERALSVCQSRMRCMESGRNSAMEAEKKDARKAWLALSKANFTVPVDGYGWNSSWAVSDMCRCVKQQSETISRLRAEIEELKIQPSPTT